MGCPRCSKAWLKVEGNRLVCSCGYVETVKMPDNADFIEKCEMELWDIATKMHKSGVRYEIIHGIFQEMIKTLELQGYTENWLNKYQKH